jgi:hypothetical protein
MSKQLYLFVCLCLLVCAGCPEEDVDDDVADDDAADDDSAPADADGDGWFADDDCNDNDPAIHPDAEESCDGKDSNCDGFLAADELDTDGDGWLLCEEDCDDEDAAVYPGAEEVCDLVDNDCDSETPAEQHCNPRPLDTADAIFRGETNWDEAGFSVAFAGDVNADGFDDVLVGAPEDDMHNEGPGHSMLYYGPRFGEVPFEEADVVFYGASLTGYTGYAVSTAGDTNADGFDDVLISTDLGSSLFLGPVSAGDHDSSDGDAFFDLMCSSFAAMGDTDGDGYDDVLVGLGSTAAAHLYLGPVGGHLDASMADAVFVSVNFNHDHAGRSVANAGDVDADGYVDYLIGAPHTNADESGAGAAHLVYGPVSGDFDLGNSDATVLGENLNGGLGYYVTGAGDVNGDGLDDILIGSDHLTQGFLFLGPVAGTCMASEADTLIGVGHAGIRASAPAGDLDGNGYDDILLATPTTGGGIQAYLLYGPVGGGTVDLEVVPAQAFYNWAGLFPMSVAGGGDVDGDSVMDVLIGADGNDDAFLFYGSLL